LGPGKQKTGALFLVVRRKYQAFFKPSSLLKSTGRWRGLCGARPDKVAGSRFSVRRGDPDGRGKIKKIETHSNAFHRAKTSVFLHR
jgi:hypothetical protein|tara:strand:- start:5426 stop:5683 length:258 start_codon:yes stop_codon:yes gene_type:complete